MVDGIDRGRQPAGPMIPALMVGLSLTLQNVGAAFAKSLFPVVGVEGMTALRVGIAACLLAAIWRPWRGGWPGRLAARDLVVYGATLGLMNLLIYQAFERIPLGIALAIEVTGPLTVALLGSRRKADFAWLACAVAGLLLLLPIRADAAALDPVGLAYAAGAATCWAVYILTSKRASAGHGGRAVAWGMMVAASFTVPLGAVYAGSALLSPGILATGIAVAVLSSAAPYTLEMFALRGLSSRVFGVIVSGAPAVASLAGIVILGEHLTLVQWAAIGLIIIASAASAQSEKPAAEAAPAKR